MSTSMNTDLDGIRAAAQELHGKISDAAAKSSGAVKADLEAAGQKAKSVTASIKASVSAQNQAAQTDLKAAVAYLEEVQKHASEGLKNTGPAFQAAVRQTLADARASVQKVSEAVAATRSANSRTRK